MQASAAAMEHVRKAGLAGGEMNERTPLLGEPAENERMYETSNGIGKGKGKVPDLSESPVYSIIHKVYEAVVHRMDIPLEPAQVRSPVVMVNVIEPLAVEFAALKDPCIVYVLLLNRLHFVRERDSAMSSSTLNAARAEVCEILAVKLLRHQAAGIEDSGEALVMMARALVGGFHAFQGASPEVIERIRRTEGYTNVMIAEGVRNTNALELAILSRARLFIKSQTTQRVIASIWEGRVVYTASSYINFLPDRWKTHEIKQYNLAAAPVLDHYRLRVPRFRAIIESLSFLVLFISFLAVVLERRSKKDAFVVHRLTSRETWFFIYALGYSLDRLASILEHGWSVFSAGLTNGLDAFCMPIFGVAFAFRIHSIVANDAWASQQAFAILSCSACLMFPRLAFGTISNNVMILSLRAMLSDFFYLMAIAVFCFLGFVFALDHLANGKYSPYRIAEWLIFIWFGLDGTGIDTSPKFHHKLGPILFVSYAALSNTLLVSLLVAILSGTYATIAADAAAEDMFRRAVMTFEGVKCDSLFDYIPPLNLVALVIMWPISLASSPRWFHKINVATTRTLSLPILLLIALYERQATATAPIRQHLSDWKAKILEALPDSFAQKLTVFEGAHWECKAVFEYTASGDEKSDDDSLPEMEGEDDVATAMDGTNERPRDCSRASVAINAAARQTHLVRSESSSRTTTPVPASSPPSTSSGTSTIKSRKLHFAHPINARDTSEADDEAEPAHSQPPSSPRPMNAVGEQKHHRHRRNSSSTGVFEESALSLSAPHDSPLTRLYSMDVGPDAVDDIRSASGVRRRMSLGPVPARRSTLAARAMQRGQESTSNAELRAMIEQLTATVARLERKLDEKTTPYVESPTQAEHDV